MAEVAEVLLTRVLATHRSLLNLQHRRRLNDVVMQMILSLPILVVVFLELALVYSQQQTNSSAAPSASDGEEGVEHDVFHIT